MVSEEPRLPNVRCIAWLGVLGVAERAPSFTATAEWLRNLGKFALNADELGVLKEHVSAALARRIVILIVRIGIYGKLVRRNFGRHFSCTRDVRTVDLEIDLHGTCQVGTISDDTAHRVTIGVVGNLR